MNCFEALNEILINQPSAFKHLYIVDFDELPDIEQPNFDYYEKDKHLLICCTKTREYFLLG